MALAIATPMPNALVRAIAERLAGASARAPALVSPLSAAALLAGVLAGLMLPALPSRPMMVLALLVGMGLAMPRWPTLRPVALVVIGMAFVGLQAAAALDAQLPDALRGRVLEVTGQIVELPVHETRRTRFEFRVEDNDRQPPALRGRVVRLAWYDDDPRPRHALRAGSRWQMPVKLRPPRGLRNPGGSDAEKFAMAARISATGSVAGAADAKRLAAPTGIDAWREGMSDRIARSVRSQSSRYVRALALGDTRGLDQRDWTRLRAAGLTHLIAISGFHVGLVAGFCALFTAASWWCMPLLGRRLPRPLAAGAGAVGGAFGYAVLTGMAVPTLRTAVMIAALVAARFLRRRLRMADTLAIGCIVLLLLDPLAVLGAGFWLSFAGVAWLVWCLPDGDGKGWAGMARGFVAAQAVASIGLLPLTVVLFGQASVAGPVANLLAVPWWSLVVVPLSLLGVLAETLHAGAGAWLWQLSAWCFDATWPVLGAIADSPLAMAWLPQPAWYSLPLALAGALWLLLPPGLPGRPLALLLWLPLLLPARGLPARGEAELVMVDVGQGLSVLVRTHAHSLLFDMGAAVPDGYDAGERAVVPSLHGLGVRALDAGIVSHADNDHVGGLASIALAFPVKRLLAPQGAAVERSVPCLAGQRWEWDAVVFTFLHPTDGFPYLGNESGCVLRIETTHGSALLMGDVGHYVERLLLEKDPDALRSNVVFAGHHGSAGSSMPEFVAATGAQLALVSTGADNRFRHPRQAIVERWCGSGAEVLDTSRSGAVRVWLGEGGVATREQRRFAPRLWDAVRRRGQDTGLCYAPENARQ